MTSLSYSTVVCCSFYIVFVYSIRRVMELLMQDWSFSAKLRLPAISRLQKIHNVDVALQVLKDKGVDLKDDQGNYCQHKLSSTKKTILSFFFFFLPFVFL